MRTTIIPAQITTVEDKIAGSLSMTQIGILMIPIFFGTLMFAVIPPTMHVVVYKIPPVILVLFVSSLLSLRIKGKVVALWVMVVVAYNLRPKYYIFNKNDRSVRENPMVENLAKEVSIKPVVKKGLTIPAEKFGVKELKALEAFMKNSNYSFSLKPGKEGGLYVVVSEVQK